METAMDFEMENGMADHRPARTRTRIPKTTVSLNWGTITLAASIKLEGKVPRTLNLAASQPDTPQKVAWDKDGKFVWGHDIVPALKLKLIEPEDVIELFKLCLYDDFTLDRISLLVHEQLALKGKTIYDLISEHLAAITVAVRESMKHDSVYGHFDHDSIDDVEIKLLISVPQMWLPPSNQMMAYAAGLAGISNATLVYEPQCAAAFVAHNLQEFRDINQPKIGDVFLVCDPGGGTGDFVSYEVVGGTTAGAQLRLKVAKPPEGSLCGSQHINEEFLRWLKEDGRKKARAPPVGREIVGAKGRKKKASARKENPILEEKSHLEKWCEDVGVSIPDALRQANEQFEVIKKLFFQTGLSPDTIRLESTDRRQRPYYVDVSSDLMVQCWDPVVSKIKTHIASQFTDNTKVIVMAGAISRSKYFKTITEQFLKGLNTVHKTNCRILEGSRESGQSMSHTVCLGALHRYPDIEPSDTPCLDSFGIGIDEELDPVRHKDAMYEPGEEKEGGTRGGGEIGAFSLRTGRRLRGDKAVPNPHKVFRGEGDRKEYVKNRMLRITDPTVPQVPGQPHISVLWQWNYVDKGDTSPFETSKYWINPNTPYSDKIIDGSPIFERLPTGEDGPDHREIYRDYLREGVYHWGITQKTPMPDFKSLGFTLTDISENDVEEESGEATSRKASKKRLGTRRRKGWVFLTRMEVTRDGPNVRFKVQMAMPGKGPYKKRGPPPDKMDTSQDGEEDLNAFEDQADEHPDDDIWDETQENAPMDPNDLYDLEDSCLVSKKFNTTPLE